MKRTIKRTAAIVLGLMLGAVSWAGLESVTHISDLNSSWPLGSDLASTSDDHIRNIKVALKTDFPNITGPVTLTQAQINSAILTSSSPTWTGVHTFTPTAGTAITVNAPAGGISARFTDGTSDFRFSHSGGNSTFATSTNTSLSLGTAGNPKLTIANTGGVSIAAPTAGNALSLTGLANSFTALFAGSATSSQSFGLSVRAGTNSSDTSFEVDNSGGSSAYFQVRGDGALTGRGPTAAALVDMTPDKGTFTGTLTGMTAGTTGTVNWVRMGNVVFVYLASAISGTSNTNAMTMTGLPAAIQPVTTQIGQCPVTDGANGTIVGTFSITGGTLTFGRATLNVSVIMYAQAFQTSGAKGLPAGWLISYSLL